MTTGYRPVVHWSKLWCCNPRRLWIRTAFRMSSHLATIIDGAALAKSIRQEITDKIVSQKATHHDFQPGLAIVQAGERADSTAYIRMKRNAAQELGIAIRHIALPLEATTEQLVSVVKTLNEDSNISGILVQLPLGPHIDSAGERTVIEAITPKKDVDGFHPYNIGNLYSRASTPLFAPCTPAGIIKLLEFANVTISGAHAVVLGRSDIVGNPVAAMLRRKDATVTQCHRFTKNVEKFVQQADILIVAIGRPQFIKGTWIKPGAVVIDVGMNYIPDSTRKSGQRLVGDVDYEEARQVASKITPVPGGVGPMTVAMLMFNTMQSAERLWHARTN